MKNKNKGKRAKISVKGKPGENDANKVEGVDGKWGWFVVFNSFVCNMIVDGMQYTFGNFLNPIAVALHASISQTSLIGSIMSGFYNFSGPIAGALGNKFGFRMVAITGSLISSAGLMLSYFAVNIYYLYFLYGIIGGLGFGMIYMASVLTTSVYFDKYRALAVSICVCGTGCGTFLFAPMGDFLVTSIGWRSALVVEGVMILLCILCALSFKTVEIFKVVPLSPEDSGALSRSAHDSLRMLPERRKTLANEVYPTYKEAILYRGSVFPAQNERRSTIISLMPKNANESSEQVLSNIENVSVPDEKPPPPPPSQLPQTSPQESSAKEKKIGKCKRFCNVCCFNFWHCSCKQKELTIGDRPMYRDDVFYGNSLSNLKHSHSEGLQYHMSVTRIPDPREIEEHMQRKCCGCQAVTRTIVTMLGLNLLKSKIFLFLCISSFFYTMGLYVPYVFVKNLGLECNVPENHAIWLVSAIGLSNTAGRLLSGIIKNFVNINSALFALVCLCFSGIYSTIFFFCCNIYCIASFSCIFGIFTAPFISLRPVIIVDFLGLEKLTNAFGLVLLSQGVASVLGPPLAGMLVEFTSKYEYVMYFSGGLMLLSSITLLISTIMNFYKNKKSS